MDYSDITTQVCDLHEQHLKELMILHDSTLKQGEEGVLLCLRRHNNCLAGDLGEALGLTTGRVANILKKLEAKQLIMRSSQLDDKRKVIVSLTKDGHEQAEQLYQDVYQQHEKLISYIGVEDAKVMLAILEKIFSYIKAH